MGFWIILCLTVACARTGLCQATLYVLKAKPNALAFGGPPCSSFVWLNVATSKRSKSRPLGDVARDYIRSANKLLERICFFPNKTLHHLSFLVFQFKVEHAVLSLFERGSGWRAAGHFCCYFALCGKSSLWQSSLNLHWWNSFPTWNLSLGLSRESEWSGWKLSCSLVALSTTKWNMIFHFFHGSLRSLGCDNTSGKWELMVRWPWSRHVSMEQRFALSLNWWVWFAAMASKNLYSFNFC